MIEVEIKLPLRDLCETRVALLDMGFKSRGRIIEEDAYLENKAGEIRGQDRALRVRKVQDLETGEKESHITYKGNRMDKVSMTRKELETGVENPEMMIDILGALGYEVQYPKVVKDREELGLGAMTACLDRVKDLGDFMELEILVPEGVGSGQDLKEAALERISTVLGILGYSMDDTTRTSYHSMLLGVED